MSDIIIREAAHKDLPHIMALQESSYVSELLEPEIMFRRILDVSSSTCFITFSGKQPSGYLLTHPIPDDFNAYGKGLPELTGKETALYIHDMCVSPDYRAPLKTA